MFSKNQTWINFMKNLSLHFGEYQTCTFPMCTTHILGDKVCYEITYPFQNFHVAAVKVWEWISNFILNLTGHKITYPCLDLKLIRDSKKAQAVIQLVFSWGIIG